MKEEFTEAERRLAKVIGKTPEEARKLLKEAQKKIVDNASDLDFTKPKPDPPKAKPP